jgi:hypothetical protein
MDEIQGHMLACEARYWKEQVRRHGHGWWNARKDAIKKKRGAEALKQLQDEMNGKTQNGKPK